VLGRVRIRFIDFFNAAFLDLAVTHNSHNPFRYDFFGGTTHEHGSACFCTQ
jgi:hypothetical protein